MLSAVQGQTEGVRHLRCAIEGRFTSPLLLVGKAGVGKKFSVLEAAKEAFSGEDPDFHCRQVDQGVHPDLKVLSPEADKDIGVDAVRKVLEESRSFPFHAKFRLFVIDGADRLTTAAANALLKTLEEPPKVARFFLLAEHLDSVLPTITSRCGLVRYRTLSEAFILAQIQRFESDATKALVYTRLAEGSVGKAVGYWGSGRLRLRDQVLTLLKPDIHSSIPDLFSAVDALGDDLVLGLTFLEHLLCDLFMIDHMPSRITNVDVADTLGGLRAYWSHARILELLSGLRTVQEFQRRKVKIQLPYHVKSALSGVGA